MTFFAYETRRDEMGWMAAMIHIAMHMEIIVEEGKYLLAVEKWSI